MVIHSTLFFGQLIMLPFLLGALLGLLVAAGLFIARKRATARKLFLVCAGIFGTYVVVIVGGALLTPQTIVNVGDSYCWDIWCMGVAKVHALPGSEGLTYKLAVRIFSDANHVQTRADADSLYLVDENGRRFPLVQEASTCSFKTDLSPGDVIHCTLTFVAAPDAHQLFLSGDIDKPLPTWAKLLIPFLPMDPHFGWEEGPLRKRTLLRVL